MMSRKYILDTLEKVFARDGYASLLMRSAPENTDMAFVSEVVYGTIRNYSLLEAQWRADAGKTKLRTALLIDMTVYQLFFLDGVPAYAAVSEGVSLAPPRERKFVNAILRKVQGRGLQIPDDPSIRFSMPQWILGLWKAHYGEETMRMIAESMQKRGGISGRINTLKADRRDFENDPAFEFVSETAFRYSGSLQKTDAFREGRVLIQDLHSQEVVRMLQPEAGMKVLDACAAPGTKTQQIACLMQDQGSIIAQDLYEARTGLIRRQMELTGVHIVEAVCADAAEQRHEDKEFDRILIDAPCSGLGDLRHKPEIRWHLKPEDIDEITLLQKRILEASAAALKEGGILVYSTCTLNKKENDGQVNRFLQAHPEYELLEMKTLFPFEDDSDGFFAAKLRRK